MPVPKDAVLDLMRMDVDPEEYDAVRELWNIVIGPQGVVEEAIVTGTHSARWLDLEPTGERLTWRNAIFFPWEPSARLFQGERVYTDMPRRST